MDQTKVELEHRIRRYRERLDRKLNWLDQKLDQRIAQVKDVPRQVGRFTMTAVVLTAAFFTCVSLIRRFPPLRRPED